MHRRPNHVLEPAVSPPLSTKTDIKLSDLNAAEADVLKGLEHGWHFYFNASLIGFLARRTCAQCQPLGTRGKPYRDQSIHAYDPKPEV